MESKYRVNDVVVYRKTKRSTSPGPRAEELYPAEQGDSYTYIVAKYWRVVGLAEDNQVDIVTRTGKRHRIPASDPNLRKANIAERFALKSRFPAPVQSA